MFNLENICTLYVSQQFGNDENNGFCANCENGTSGPFKTLEKAILKVSDMRDKGFIQPVSIKITDGVYNITKPVVIDERVYSVTIEPYASTEICGGIEIDNFNECEYNGIKCLCADLTHLENMDFSDFYVNGKPASVTVYPETGVLNPKDVENNTDDFYLGSKWFIAKDEDFEVIKNFKTIEDAYISYYHYWIDEHSPIESFDENAKKITMKYVSRFDMTHTIASSNIDYVIENVGEMLKKPGQWYCDKKEKKLYYIPENTENADSVKGYIPVTDKFFCIKGTLDKKVKNVRIRNFSFCYTKGEYKSTYDTDKYRHPSKKDGFASDIQSVCHGHGSIEFEFAQNCSIENCRLNCLGVHAVNLKDGCFDIDIVNNSISYIGGGGVYVSGQDANSENSTHTHDVNIHNNTILYCGRRYYASCGILIRHGYNCRVSHNEIGYVYYTGVSCGWVWGYGENISRNNIIEKNHIHHLGGGLLSDMGGIYTLGVQPGTVVRGNVVHDVESRHYGGWALYTDEGSSGILLENNVCYNTSDNVYHQHYGSMNTVRNNIFAFSKDAVIRHSHNTEKLGIICENNIIVIDGNSPFRLRDKYDGEIKAIVSKNNFIYDYTKDYKDEYFVIVSDDKCVFNDTYVYNEDKANTPEQESDIKYTYDQAKNVIGVEDGSVFLDPGFEDIENFNFNLKSTSPVYKLGFKPIDTSDVGPIK